MTDSDFTEDDEPDLEGDDDDEDALFAGGDEDDDFSLEDDE